VIPEPSDQQQHRRNRGRRGGRPPAFDSDFDKRRNVIERGFTDVKHWRGIATQEGRSGWRCRRLENDHPLATPFTKHALAGCG